MGTYTCTSIAAVRKHIAQVARLFGFTLTYPQIDKKAQEKLSDMTFHLTKKLPGMGDTMRVHVTTKETA